MPSFPSLSAFFAMLWQQGCYKQYVTSRRGNVKRRTVMSSRRKTRLSIVLSVLA